MDRGHKRRKRKVDGPRKEDKIQMRKYKNEKEVH